ncbi:MAG: AMP-binding protein, partial [Deltaproteobacteria bacterium]|nr:AMP-binding protein [Deltaproteobacteria bacterium]
MTIWMTFERALKLYPEKIALIDGDISYTYQQIGDAFLEVYYAAASLGAILNPINYRLAAKEIAFILNNAGTRWLIAGTRFASLVKGALREGVPLEGILWIGEMPQETIAIDSYGYENAISAHPGSFEAVAADENQIAHLYYTSGTTGQPKGVTLTHKNVCYHALGAIAEIKLVDTDIWGHIAPMFHLADAWATFAITWVGGRHVMVSQFDAETVMSAIEKEKITLSNLIPTMLNQIIKHPRVKDYQFSSLRVILSGGAPIAPELVRDIMHTFGCDYVQTYGMTETSPYLTLSILKEHLKKLPPEEQLRYKSKTGRPFIGVDLKVVNDRGVPIAADEQQV